MIVMYYCQKINKLFNMIVLFLSSVYLFVLFLIPSHKRLTDWGRGGGGGGDSDKPPSVSKN